MISRGKGYLLVFVAIERVVFQVHFSKLEADLRYLCVLYVSYENGCRFLIVSIDII